MAMKSILNRKKKRKKWQLPRVENHKKGVLSIQKDYPFSQKRSLFYSTILLLFPLKWIQNDTFYLIYEFSYVHEALLNTLVNVLCFFFIRFILSSCWLLFIICVICSFIFIRWMKLIEKEKLTTYKNENRTE